jgi:phosphonate transport system permease protein
MNRPRAAPASNIMSERIPPPPPPKLNAFRVTLILFLLAVIFSWPALGGSGRSLPLGDNLHAFLIRFWPPDFSIWPQISVALWETFQIAVLSTLFSTILSVPLAVAASQNISPTPVVWITRSLLNIIRSIPSLIWALLAVAVLGANALSGVVALTFYSMGYLGKFFSDAIESADAGVAEALRASGADAIQSFQYGIWPHAKPLIWSHSLWMLEYNIRSAAIIGYVGAGGIGVYLHSYQEFAQWDRFSAVLCCLLALVIVLDFAGQRVRKHFVAIGG